MLQHHYGSQIQEAERELKTIMLMRCLQDLAQLGVLSNAEDEKIFHSHLDDAQRSPTQPWWT